jgi:dTDP-6-deoxy-L-talose 4-dehydrogenase (NAD+)
MRLFVTGATGFIGRAFCRVALERGHRVLALCRNANASLPEGTEMAVGTLAETPWAQVEQFAPDAVLHLAWVATPAIYLTSPENEIWLEQSKAWFLRLHEIGVPHLAGTGTCIEYAASTKLLNETTSRLDPAFLYSQAKAALFQWLRNGALESKTAWSWFRVFYPYGPGEHPSRICSSLISQLSAGKSLALRTPHSVKDYVFVDDVARAMCLALESKMPGAINIGTGLGVSIQDLATRIAELLQVDTKLICHANELAFDPTPAVIADSELLRSTGWEPTTSLDDGLLRLIHFLRETSSEHL